MAEDSTAGVISLTAENYTQSSFVCAASLRPLSYRADAGGVHKFYPVHTSTFFQGHEHLFCSFYSLRGNITKV